MKNVIIYIISLKYAPGLKKEFSLIGENLRNKGYCVKYLLAEEYKNMEYECGDTEYFNKSTSKLRILNDTANFIFKGRYILKKYFIAQSQIYLLFYNPHPINPILSKSIKILHPNTVAILYLHDPYKPDKRPYGYYKRFYISLVEYIQGLTVKYIDYVVSPSEYSHELFEMKYPQYNKNSCIAPLLIPNSIKSDNINRRYFSIIGTAHHATGHDTFVDLVNYSISKGMDYEFAIISASNLNKYLKRLNDNARSIVRIINKNNITDSEINQLIRESWGVFRMDHEVTQSGVIPVSFMNETPVIARDIKGLNQHIIHRYNGYLFPRISTSNEIISGMDYVKGDFFRLSQNSRKSYEDIWAEKNFDRYYGWLINLLE